MNGAARVYVEVIGVVMQAIGMLVSFSRGFTLN